MRMIDTLIFETIITVESCPLKKRQDTEMGMNRTFIMIKIFQAAFQARSRKEIGMICKLIIQMIIIVQGCPLVGNRKGNGNDLYIHYSNYDNTPGCPPGKEPRRK